MGLDPDREFGEDVPCVQNCDPPLWAPGETPLYVYVSFTGMAFCDQPGCWGQPFAGGHILTLEQMGGDNKAYWEGFDDDFWAQWKVCPNSLLSFGTRLGVTMFHSSGVSCQTSFENQFDCDTPNNCAFSGSGVVTWAARVDGALAVAGLQGIADTKFEFWPGK